MKEKEKRESMSSTKFEASIKSPGWPLTHDPLASVS
jgi:hypothetical protein